MRSVALLAAAALLLPTSGRAEWRCGTERGLGPRLVALHGYWRAARPASAAARPADRDQGDVAVLTDRGDLIARRNVFDLEEVSLRFTPNAAGGYDLTRLTLAPGDSDRPIQLADNDVQAVELAFEFPFYGRRYSRVFVHSDGNLTLGEPGVRPATSLAQFLSGPARVAGLLADLDPSRGGEVSTRLTAERASFLWSEVPGASQVNRSTIEITLHARGAIDLSYGERVETREAIVGLSPGGVSDASVADLSSARPSSFEGALAERFSETERVDLAAVTHRFFATHADSFDQLVVYTTRPLNPLAGTLAFEVNVRNEVQGIGLPAFDNSALWGSGGVLASVVYMDSIDLYLDVDGFEILGHEVGHRWLARLLVRNQGGHDSSALLGRGDVHWSFFLDSDASVLEGNDIAEREHGRFETVDFARRFSALDQYVMGLRLPGEVPLLFYVGEADNFRPNRPFKISSAPEAGVRFTGLRQDVDIEDVIRAMGPRIPDATRARNLLRQAYVLVEDAQAPATETRTAAVNRIRERFEGWYEQATDGRGRVETQLR
jgi:hypothetical protein